MSKEDPNDINYYHNKGEKDCSEGKHYNPPNNLLGGGLNTKTQTEQKIAYSKGWDNSGKQKSK